MCRLYGLRSTHPTAIGCELIEAQNSLIHQSLKDQRGHANPHGWGLGYWRDRHFERRRQARPASESEEFRRSAENIHSPLVIAHVRRATVGVPNMANAHPFYHVGDDYSSIMAHNGHLGAFQTIRPALLEAMSEHMRHHIDGTTDSEHFFGLLLSRYERNPEKPLVEILRETILDVRRWSQEANETSKVALNILWAVDDQLVGSRLNRTLWYIERDEPHRCEVCGRFHAHPKSDDDYHVVELSSEKISHENWNEMPEASVFSIGPNLEFEIEPLEQ